MRKPKDMTGTARCGVCAEEATHERGPGSPLSIRHKLWCSEGRWTPRLPADLEESARRFGIPLPEPRKQSPIVRVLHAIEEATWGDPRLIEEASVKALLVLMPDLTEGSVRYSIRWLMEGRFITRSEFKTERGRWAYAYYAVRKDS